VSRLFGPGNAVSTWDSAIAEAKAKGRGPLTVFADLVERGIPVPDHLKADVAEMLRHGRFKIPKKRGRKPQFEQLSKARDEYEQLIGEGVDREDAIRRAAASAGFYENIVEYAVLGKSHGVQKIRSRTIRDRIVRDDAAE
jgi:hypothetical protein